MQTHHMLIPGVKLGQSAADAWWDSGPGSLVFYLTFSDLNAGNFNFTYFKAKFWKHMKHWHIRKFVMFC